MKTVRVNWYSQTHVDFTLLEDGEPIGSVTMGGASYDSFMLALRFAGWAEDLISAEDRTKPTTAVTEDSVVELLLSATSKEQ